MNTIVLTFKDVAHNVNFLGYENPIIYHRPMEIKVTDLQNLSNSCVILTDDFIASTGFGKLLGAINFIPKPCEVIFLLPRYEDYEKAKTKTFLWAWDQWNKHERGKSVNARQSSLWKYLRIIPHVGKTDKVEEDVRRKMDADWNWLERYGPLFTKEDWQETYNYFQRCRIEVTSE